MPILYYASKEIAFKIAYLGAPGSGCRTNLTALLERFGVVERTGAELPVTEDGLHVVELSVTALDVRGFHPRLVLCAAGDRNDPRKTVPRLTRGADGIVFVADASRRRANLEVAELVLAHRELAVPLVLQCNKRDAPGAAVSADVFASLFMLQPVATHESVALAGIGVYETLHSVTLAVVERHRAQKAPP